VNDAVRWVESVLAIGGLAEADAFSEDFRREDRRSTVAAEPADRYQLVESLRIQHEMGAVWSNEVVAVRDERFGLFRLTFDDDGSEVAFLTVPEVDEVGRARRVVYFDGDDVPAAFGELDRRWRESYSGDQRLVLETAARCADATMRGERDALEDVTTDDMYILDHRPLGKGRLERSDLIENVASRPDVMGDEWVVVATVHGVDAGILVMTGDVVRRSPDDLEYRDARVQVWHIRDGRVAAIEIFAASDLGAALERVGVNFHNLCRT
jgi:ketosteroid isomerase-like protein